VLGGTFDPVHLGHLASATDVARTFQLERVLLMLSARPPHKPTHRPAAIEDRWAMLELATHGRAGVEPSDLETKRDGPSYTVDTLAELAALRPGVALYLIIGIDAWREVDTWHRPELLLARANIVVTTRPGHAMTEGDVLPPIAARNDCCYDPAIGCQRHKSGHLLLIHRLDGLLISATEVRKRAAAGLDVADLTGVDVARYIRTHRLYQEITS
jgi:nicotinate-nucleotide adenylyltransferase